MNNHYSSQGKVPPHRHLPSLTAPGDILSVRFYSPQTRAEGWTPIRFTQVDGSRVGAWRDGWVGGGHSAKRGYLLFPRSVGEIRIVRLAVIRLK